MARLSFHGGAGTVTGSKYLLETERGRVLIDCGLFQGRKKTRELNWRPLAFPPHTLDAVLLTHAHIDHSGFLPRLVRDGFKGPIYCTPATADLADLLLRDSAYIQEEDAEYANKKGYSKHKPALPLYTVQDAVNAVKQLEPIDYNSWCEPASQLRFRFKTAGHIIGSGMIEAEILETDTPLRCLFSGDVGRYDAPLVPDPHEPDPCDVLVVESTYGDRSHPDVSIQDQLKSCLEHIVSRDGQMLVPAFAVGRSQQLVVLLAEVMRDNPKLALPIHLDSPMAVNTTKIYGKYAQYSGLEEVDLRSGRSPIYGDNVYLHKKRDESMRLNDVKGPRVIISSSGMMTGGRVLHHLKRLVTDDRNLIVLAGYQAPGTRGWRLQRGEETVRIHGRDIEVRARMSKISGLSAHADANQLVHWLRDLPAPKRTFIVHGDDGAPQALAKRFEAELGHHCETPELGDSYAL